MYESKSILLSIVNNFDITLKSIDDIVIKKVEFFYLKLLKLYKNFKIRNYCHTFIS